jgi:hypothetical protein
MTLTDHIRRKIDSYICNTGQNPTKLILGWEDHEILNREALTHLQFVPLEKEDKIKESFMGLALTKSKRKRYVCVLGKRRPAFQREYLASLWKYDDNSYFKSVFNK